MARIGKKPIPVPTGVTVSIEPELVRVHGPRGELAERVPLAISGLKRVSRPGRRTYAGSKDIPKVLGGMGTAIVSTSRGVMTGHEARSAGVGGEVVAHVW